MPTSPDHLDLRAFAKLNLFLHVTGRRDDGFHLLQSVFVRIDWCDELRLSVRHDALIVRHDMGMHLPPDDLCLRAARSLQAASGTSLGADIRIDKRLPSGAGMGGGSADAAAVLAGLNTLWQLHWPTDRLQALALQLGADVPFFLQERHAWVEGVGEQIQPIDLPPALLQTPLAVIKPPAALPTPEIFRHPSLPRDTARVSPNDFLHHPRNFGHNDLQVVAQAICPDVREALDLASRLFSPARMTGSGSAVFAWLPEGMDAAYAQQRLAAHLPDPQWTGRVCHLLPT